MNILLKLEDEAKVLCHGHTKKLFLLSWNALILRVEINSELLASYLSANSVPDSENNHSKPWLTFKLSLYLSFGSVGSCSFSHLMISLQIIFQKCTMKCRKAMFSYCRPCELSKTLPCFGADDKVFLLKHGFSITRILCQYATFWDAFSDNRAPEQTIGR